MSNPKMPEGNLIKIRLKHWYEGYDEKRELQFVYDNGAVIGMPYDAYSTEDQEFDVPFAEQPNNESQ